MSDFEQADAMVVGAGERAATMSEQFALDERFGERAAVDGDHRFVGARTLIM